jgi:subtilisin-like proprotein convertase family protein
MKKFYNLLLVTIFSLVASAFSLKAQCPNDNSEYTSLGAPTTIGQSVGVLIDGTPICIYAGEYYTITNFQAGFTYRISTCQTTGIADTRLTVYPSAGGAAVGFNDDFCGLLAQFDFTPTTTGDYRVLLDATGPGNTCTTTGDDCGIIIITLISNSTGGAYCTPIYGNPGGTSNGDYIDGVSLGNINNQNTGSASGASYNNYTNLSPAVLNPSTQYTLSIKNNPDFTEQVSAWIDYNQDLVFSEDERLGQISITDAEVGTITFTTPASIIDGNTRLRVRMAFTVPNPSGLIDPCTSIQYGETEDYTVLLLNSNAPPLGTSFSTACGIATAIADNACPNYTLASVRVDGLGVLGTTHSIKSAEILISHPMAADLDVYLVAPNGQEVELSTDNGGDGANYGTYSLADCSLRTVFDQSASTSITAGTAPFVGTFIPEGNMNNFNTSAVDPNGFWRLRVCDDFAGDAGVIQFFKLNFEENPTELPSCTDTYSIADAATDVSVSTVLSWTAGTGSPDTYDVYFGTSETPALASNDQVGLSYSPTLSAGTTYYYQIVPSNNVGSATGCPIRSFTTASSGVTYVMTNGTVTTCSGTFVDDGGATDNYGNGQFLTFTVFPSTPGSVVKVDFSSIVLDGIDLFAVGDGVDIGAPAIGTFFGGSYSDTSFTATNPDGALTFLFFSDGAVTAPGWIGTFSCVAPEPIPECATNLSPADNATDVSTATSITWTAAAGNPTGYNVYFGTSSNPQLVETNQPETSYTPISLLPATTYYYIISPLNATGAATCDTLSFTTAALPQAGILMGNASLTVCDTAFFDAGGSTGTAGLNQNSVLVLTPSTPNSHLVVTFNAFNTELDTDILTVYNGSSVASPVLETYSGSALSVPCSKSCLFPLSVACLLLRT